MYKSIIEKHEARKESLSFIIAAITVIIIFI